MGKFDEDVLAKPPMYEHFKSKFEGLELSWREAFVVYFIVIGKQTLKAAVSITFFLIVVATGFALNSEYNIGESIKAGLIFLPWLLIVFVMNVGCLNISRFDEKWGVSSRIDRDNNAELDAFTHYLVNRPIIRVIQDGTASFAALLFALFLISLIASIILPGCQGDEIECPTHLRSEDHFDDYFKEPGEVPLQDQQH